MRKALVFIILACYFSPLHAQLSKLDSAQWYQGKTDNLWINDIPKELFEPYAKRGAVLFQELGMPIQEGDCYRNLAAIYAFDQQDYQTASELIHQALHTNAKAAQPSIELQFLCYRDLLSYKKYLHQKDSVHYYINQLISFGAQLKPVTEQQYFSIKQEYALWNASLCGTKRLGLEQLSLTHLAQGNLPQAKELLDSIAQMPECQGAHKWQLAGLYMHYDSKNGDYNAALTEGYQTISLLKTHRPEDTYLLPPIYQSLASVYQQLGLDQQAIVCYEKSLSYQRKLNFVDSVQLSKLYNGVGELYRSMGEYEKALDYYHFAKDLIQSMLGEVNFSMGSVCNNIGESYYALGNYSKALAWHKKSLAIRLQIDDHPYRTNSYDNLGITYLQLGDLENAEHYLKKGYQLRTKFPKTAPYAAYYIKSYLHIAELRITQGRYDKAIKCYQYALQSNIADIKSEHLAKFEVWNKLGRLYTHRKDWANAQIAFQQAIKLNAPNYRGQIKGFKNYHNAISLLNSIAGLAHIAYQEALQSSQDAKLRQSVEQYQLAMELLTKIRQSYSFQKDKLSIGKYAKSIYNQAMEVNYLLYQQTQDQQFLTAMFLISEQSKAGILLDAQNKQIAQRKGILPDSLIERESRYAALNSFYQQKINESKGKEMLVWKQKLFDVKQKQESLNRKLEQLFPDYFKLKYESHVVSIKELQAQLKPHEAFLEFYEGEQQLFAFLADQDSFIVKVFPKLQNTLVQDFRKSIITRNWQLYTKTANQLYARLIEPFERLNQGKLTIIPDGMLWHINFDLLIRKLPKSGDYRQLHYVLNDLSVRYAYSISYLLKSSKSNVAIHDVLAFAPSYESLNQDQEALGAIEEKFRDKVGPLVHSTKEVESIHEQVGGEIFIGKEAIERVFKSHMESEHAIIHLAMHALVDNDKPISSRLVFTHEEDSVEDNFLHVYEIYNMRLPADLAVLSACNTGFGKLESGEGFMSLGRAFAYAGCPAVVMSHWRVDDLATSKLMDVFYKKLALGMDKSDALRAAKLTYLAEAEPHAAAPFLWGSFVMMGDDSPIELTQATNTWWYGGGVLVVLLVWGIWKKRRA
ncbi:MAG: CHAT domain-containing protein [Flammeovirgaceae bacterium]